MRSFFDKVARVFGWMDAAEFAIPAILAAALLLSAPLVATFFFFRAHHYVAGTLSTGLWILTVIACIRDLRRRHLSSVSLVLGILWLITTLVILWRLETS
jgi:hypothetical protein